MLSELKSIHNEDVSSVTTKLKKAKKSNLGKPGRHEKSACELLPAITPPDWTKQEIHSVDLFRVANAADPCTKALSDLDHFTLAIDDSESDVKRLGCLLLHRNTDQSPYKTAISRVQSLHEFCDEQVEISKQEAGASTNPNYLLVVLESRKNAMRHTTRETLGNQLFRIIPVPSYGIRGPLGPKGTKRV